MTLLAAKKRTAVAATASIAIRICFFTLVTSGKNCVPQVTLLVIIHLKILPQISSKIIAKLESYRIKQPLYGIITKFNLMHQACLLLAYRRAWASAAAAR